MWQKISQDADFFIYNVLSDMNLFAMVCFLGPTVKLLFAGECKILWPDMVPIWPIFREVLCWCNDMSRHMLLSFGEAITKSKKSPEKLFVLFDMFETLHDLNWR